jgi:RsmE family RNA methyltransferase
MNLILVDRQDFISPSRVELGGRRFDHIQKVHRASVGDQFATGMINGKMGTGTITTMTRERVEMEVTLDHDPPPALGLTLVMALPRPKMLKRILQTMAGLGVKQLYLINSWRVEKGFWSAPVLEQEQIDQALILGLEQAKDTIMPRVFLRRLFTPFVREELDTIAGDTLRLAAHPGGRDVCPCHPRKNITLAVGPEGGFIQREVDAFEQLGFTSVTLGPRILRVETAVPFLISRLFA